MLIIVYFVIGVIIGLLLRAGWKPRPFRWFLLAFGVSLFGAITYMMWRNAGLL